MSVFSVGSIGVALVVGLCAVLEGGVEEFRSLLFHSSSTADIPMASRAAAGILLHSHIRILRFLFSSFNLSPYVSRKFSQLPSSYGSSKFKRPSFISSINF